MKRMFLIGMLGVVLAATPAMADVVYHGSARVILSDQTRDNQVYLFDDNGVLTGQYPQIAGAITNSWGYRDGASDGSHVYFGWEDGIARHDAGGSNAMLLFDGTNAPARSSGGQCWRALAYDPTGDDGNGSFWGANFDSPLVEVDMSGNVLNSLPNDGWSVYGLAYDETDGNLWGHQSSYPPGDVFKIDTTTGLVIPLQGWPVSPDWTSFTVAGGLSGLHDGTGRLAAVCQGSPDELGIYDLSGNLVGGPWDMESQSGTVGHLGIAVIPEPATLSLLALGGLAVVRRRR